MASGMVNETIRFQEAISEHLLMPPGGDNHVSE